MLLLMHTLRLIVRLCLTNFRSFAYWIPVGPLLFFFYGFGSGPVPMHGWIRLFAMGLLPGLFIAAIMTVNECREKKNRSLKKLEREIRSLTDGKLNLAFAVNGAMVGFLCALILGTPPIGYAIGAILLALLGLSRKHIAKIIP